MRPVYYGNQVVGEITEEKKGLYYNFSCKCKLPGKGLYRVTVSSGSRTVDLGICVPTGGSFGLVKSVPANKLGQGDLTFCLTKSETNPGFIPVADNRPFVHLEKLKKAVFCKEGSTSGVRILD